MKMFGAMLFAIALTGCATRAPYPEGARVQFEASCPSESALCACSWDKLTRTMTYEEYQAAMVRWREQGIMDSRVMRVRADCVEQHPL